MNKSWLIETSSEMQLLMMNAINNQHLRSWRWWGKDESQSQKLEFLLSELERPIGDNQYPRSFSSYRGLSMED
jgi:hypothetical protein